MDKLKSAVEKVKAVNIVEKGSSTEAPSSVMVAVRCRPCARAAPSPSLLAAVRCAARRRAVCVLCVCGLPRRAVNQREINQNEGKIVVIKDNGYAALQPEEGARSWSWQFD